MNAPWRERVVTFGDAGHLAGILSLSDEARANGAPPVLMLNAGVVHRVGAHRLNVKIARRLAAEGIVSLRFDLSGLGDSPPARTAVGYEQQSIDDIGAAMDCLKQEAGVDEAIIVGMCSGADNAYRTAVVDERIGGAVLLDPYAYESVGAKIDYMADRAANPDRWMQKLKKVAGGGETEEAALDIDLTLDIDAEDDERALDVERAPPPVAEFGGDLQKITDRGGKILIRYTSYVQGKVSKPAQFFKTFSDFDFSDRLSVDVSPHVDHTYTELTAQEELLARIPSWIIENWSKA
ncbi:MAG: alpha/beta hydrolase [Pseudomonadota bacterium]